MARNRSISLYPLRPDEVVKALLATPHRNPSKVKKRKKKQRARKKNS